MARRKKQPIPIVAYVPPSHRELADTALEDARTLIARHDVGVTDDTIDIWQTLADLVGVVADMPAYQAIIDEHEADAKAADERAKEAEQREREHSAEADQRCYRATEIEQELRAELRKHEYQVEQLSAAVQSQSVELDTLRRHKSNSNDAIVVGVRANEDLVGQLAAAKAEIARLTSQRTESSAEQTIMSNIRRRYATYSARCDGPSGMSPSAIRRDRAMAEREHGER